MHSIYESYISGCQMISLLTNLEVQVFDNQGISQLHYARYDLPAVLERFKQQAFTQILQQTFAKGQVYVLRDAIELEFLATGIWNEGEYQGIIVAGPYIIKAYDSQLLRNISQQERLSPLMLRELQQCYNALTMVDEAKQQAVSHLLVNILTFDRLVPQCIEITLSPIEEMTLKFRYELEQNRELVEQRYERENKLLHAITTGDVQRVKKALKDFGELSRPYRHPNSPVRSLKNLSFSGNTLYRKAAEIAGVHPLYLDSISGKFAIQIEQAQSLAELEAFHEEMPLAYCNAVQELSVAALPPLAREIVTYIRFNLDQPLSLNAIAEAFGLHPSYLSRICKKALGMTLTEYINRLRIEEAKYILDHGDISIIETALSVGYNDSNYFSKVFHKLEHMTPHDYRKRKK